jgi:hypothetical protein
MAIPELAEYGQEYASIVFRQEHGFDLWGDKVKRYRPEDKERLSEIEAIFDSFNDDSLPQYIENSYDIYYDNTGETI